MKLTSFPIQYLIKEVQPYYLFLLYLYFNRKTIVYLKPTLACQTNASKKNNTGIIGIISASGPNTAKAPGNLPNNNVSIEFFQFILYI